MTIVWSEPENCEKCPLKCPRAHPGWFRCLQISNCFVQQTVQSLKKFKRENVADTHFWVAGTNKNLAFFPWKKIHRLSQTNRLIVLSLIRTKRSRKTDPRMEGETDKDRATREKVKEWKANGGDRNNKKSRKLTECVCVFPSEPSSAASLILLATMTHSSGTHSVY